MKSAVSGILIFVMAYRAHRERSHGRFTPVIRDVPDDGEPWPTEGAVDKRVAISEILCREKFR